MTNILIVDDERDIRKLIGDILEDEGYHIRMAANADECLAQIKTEKPSLMILDIWLKDSQMDGIDILKMVKRDAPEIPVVIISGHGNIEIAVAAIKQGAYDFIEKPFNIDQLLVVVSRAMEASKLRRENSELRQKDGAPVDMFGSSAPMRLLKTQLEKVAKSNSRILLTGPSGVGKKTAARYVHLNSRRAQGPFVSVAAALIAPDQMAEILFGRESAERGIEQGLFEQANGGILYLDEVADMPLTTQSKILRVLVEQQFSRVGGQDKLKVDFRVISSTTRDLSAAIAAGRFRQELYDRLNVVSVAVPSLEDRRGDIPNLARYFIDFFHKSQGLALRDLNADAEALLQTMRWPGNVRQLRNVIERALILGDGGGPIEAREISNNDPLSENPDQRMVLGDAISILPLREARELFEKEYLLTQINRFGGNISRTAAFVGMERSALHRKLKSLGVVGSAKDGFEEESDKLLVAMQG